MVERTAVLLALGALFIAGCDFRPSVFSSAIGQDGCKYKGATYSHGSTACQSGTQYRCDDGEWRDLEVACRSGDIEGRMAPDGRSCMYSGVTVATQSTICKEGTSFRCEDGEWRNLGTACQ